MNGKLEPLMKTVREIEAKHNCQGLGSAVVVRLKVEYDKTNFEGKDKTEHTSQNTV